MRKCKHGHAARGLKTRTYEIWKGMKARCHNKKNKSYYNYGAKGIEVCKSWRNSYAQFLADMGEAPEGKTIDRIKGNRGYEKNNCRWASRAEQSRNTIQNRWLTFRGQTMVLQDWATKIGISSCGLRHRLTIGWPLGMALTTPSGMREL